MFENRSPPWCNLVEWIFELRLVVAFPFRLLFHIQNQLLDQAINVFHNFNVQTEIYLITGSSLLMLFFETLEKQPCKQKTIVTIIYIIDGSPRLKRADS